MLYKSFSPSLLATALVLDLGAGTNTIFDTLPRQMREVQVLTIDSTHCALGSGAEKNKHSIQADVTKLPIPNKAAVAVHCKDMLVHIRDKSAFIKEVKRVLCPKGHAVFVSVNNELTKPPFYFPFYMNSFCHLLAQHGFVTQRFTWTPKREEIKDDWYSSQDRRDTGEAKQRSGVYAILRS